MSKSFLETTGIECHLDNTVAESATISATSPAYRQARQVAQLGKLSESANGKKLAYKQDQLTRRV